MKVTFNTGRLYQAEGQIITAEARGDRVLFKDHSRLICGEWQHPQPGNYGTPTEFAEYVLLQYDFGLYRMSIEAIGLEPSDTILTIRT